MPLEYDKGSYKQWGSRGSPPEQIFHEKLPQSSKKNYNSPSFGEKKITTLPPIPVINDRSLAWWHETI